MFYIFKGEKIKIIWIHFFLFQGFGENEQQFQMICAFVVNKNKNKTLRYSDTKLIKFILPLILDCIL